MLKPVTGANHRHQGINPLSKPLLNRREEGVGGGSPAVKGREASKHLDLNKTCESLIVTQV